MPSPKAPFLRQTAHSCAWRQGIEASAESCALAAAIQLFALVFRLQTSEVRAQLLGHLGTAAVKAAEKAAKELRGGAFGLGSGRESASASVASSLANVSAALLGSLWQLRHKPSKTQLHPSLAVPIEQVLAPCLADADNAVRRAAAQSVALTAELLGASYARRFVASAQTKLADPKARDDAKCAIPHSICPSPAANILSPCPSGAASPLPSGGWLART